MVTQTVLRTCEGKQSDEMNFKFIAPKKCLNTFSEKCLIQVKYQFLLDRCAPISDLLSDMVEIMPTINSTKD